MTTRADAPAPPASLPSFEPEFILTRRGQPGQGRAGMLYRDLIPGRLGGRYIASHITIRDEGPVADWVHYHRIAFQMIYVRSGWVRVVYEDQGDPFVMHAGDLVLQPPQIRHRVLESSPGLEVVEIGCPAFHETLADHELELPNGVDPERRFGGQRFLRHIASQAAWTEYCGGEAQETAMGAATGGLADVRTIRPAVSPTIMFPAHPGELTFGFVLGGSARLEFGSGFELAGGDAFVIPPQDAFALSEMSPDLRLLHMTTSQLG